MEQKIALCIIMKDESKVITRLLSSVFSIIDYYVVVDTGSSDSSKELVRDFFKEKNIEGEIHDYPFVNFEDARNFAISKSKEKTDFSFTIDSDEILVLSENFNLENLREQLSNCDLGLIDINYGDTLYSRRAFFRNSKPFYYFGAVHEILMCKEEVVSKNISDMSVTVHSDGKSWDDGLVTKYLNHAKLITDYIDKNGEEPRHVFYLAQSYKDAGYISEAIEWYKKRVDITTGFYEERYWAQLMVAQLKWQLCEPVADVADEFMKCSELDDMRAEHLFNLKLMYERNGRPKSSLKIRQLLSKYYDKNPYPKRVLFINPHVYINPNSNSKKSELEKRLDILKLSLMGVLSSIQNEKLLNGSLDNNEIEEILEIKNNLTHDEINGLGWAYEIPDDGLTMIGMSRLDNIEKCVIDIFRNKIEGDFVETGVWRGGACIFMAMLCKISNEKRDIYICDSFEGLPIPDSEKYPADAGDNHHTYDYLKVDIDKVKSAFHKYSVLSDNTKFIKGWFSDTMPCLNTEKISLLRLDGDMYSSTWEVLINLYHKVSTGGYVIIDDYALNGCRKAVDDFRQLHNITDSINLIDNMGAYWQKSKSAEKNNPVIEVKSVDVCIVSYAKDDELRTVTEKGIESLLSSESDVKFNIFVVESNKEVNYDRYPNTKTIYTDLPFGYHRYLNLAVKEGKSEFVVLCNSDLTYEKGWASEIINSMNSDDKLLSASPFCPQTQSKEKFNHNNVHYGYIIREELAGWCIFQKREIYKVIGELDERFDFWFCDDDYSMELKKNNIAHALVVSSVVNHHSDRIGATIKSVASDKEKEILTNGQYEKFEQKWS